MKKFILLNPSFTNGPIVIDNPQAIKQIEGYLNKPIILGDEMLLSIDRVIIRLRFVDKKNDEYIFENIKLRCY